MTKMMKYNTSSMEILPTDILINVFVRLPIKSLLCLKSVCKSWRSLISSRYFSNFHRYRNSVSSERLLIFVGEDHFLYSVSFDSLDLAAIKIPFCSAWDRFSQRKIVVGSCNGLLLCLCDESSEFEALLINPSTLPGKRVPKLQAPQQCLYLSYGFGYDFVNDDYKIVRIEHFLRKGMEISVSVYSLSSDRWKLDVRMAPPLGTPVTHNNGTLVNNHLLHWLLSSWGSIDEYFIKCFDVCTEQWSEVVLPDLTLSDNGGNPSELGVVDGCLCLMSGDCGLWIMKEYGDEESWMKLFNLLDHIAIGSLETVPIAYTKEGGEILLRKDLFSAAFWYDISAKTTRKAKFHCLPTYRQVSVCTRSLVSLCGNGQLGHETQRLRFGATFYLF